jgi:hypothetical protein
MPTLPTPSDTQPPGSLSESGAAMRDQALAALERRFSVLLDRSKRRQLTGAERTEIDRLGVVIDTLQAMASGGPM